LFPRHRLASVTAVSSSRPGLTCSSSSACCSSHRRFIFSSQVQSFHFPKPNILPQRSQGMQRKEDKVLSVLRVLCGESFVFCIQVTGHGLAAFLPLAMASTTVPAPLTKSPAAKTRPHWPAASPGQRPELVPGRKPAGHRAVVRFLSHGRNNRTRLDHELRSFTGTGLFSRTDPLPGAPS